jgi:cobalt-zinc-cadmium efflux system membrane fusion protein
VLYSKDLGEKKSELVDAISQLNLDKKSLKNLQELLRNGGTSPQRVLEQERQVETSRVAVERAERTLRLVYRLEQKELDIVKAEAERLRDPEARRQLEKDKDWARADVVTRQGGVIVEKNVVAGDIVDTTIDLFKIADTDHLAVFAHAYEEDLQPLQDYEALLKKNGKQVPWTVRLKAQRDSKGLEGRITQIGMVVDPAMHTVLIMGMVPNPDGRMRAGQFITATVALPAADDEVAIPIGALVEDGRESIVFVRVNQDEPPRYQIRRVVVTRRGQEFAQVRSELTSAELDKGLKPLDLKQRVVTSGALELKAALEDALAAKASK